MRIRSAFLLVGLTAAAVSGCATDDGQSASPGSSSVSSSVASSVVSSAASTTASTSAGAASSVPASLTFGDPYPNAESPCRRLGESSTTSQWLDDSAILVGCPAGVDPAALGGKVVGQVDGITIVSVPTGDANAGLPSASAQTTKGVVCSTTGTPPTADCAAKVTRDWGDDKKSTLVEVTKPDGSSRALFFHGTTPYGADSSQADGSAAYDFVVTRQGGASVITFGPERYVVPDSLVR
ncbi:hypothetical protein [Gordonia insulae]|uniref:Uncharacterized protein n=1 Tax=Gordonia insulae TaxID=2420509 RepID=A0A3G8JJP3_9ACTN|nr:hypothetical protein [Gordonia insulae]AZG45223.1 hypothetical protein D7316_01818 [Gordonia insulae]